MMTLAQVREEQLVSSLREAQQQRAQQQDDLGKVHAKVPAAWSLICIGHSAS